MYSRKSFRWEQNTNSLMHARVCWAFRNTMNTPWTNLNGVCRVWKAPSLTEQTHDRARMVAAVQRTCSHPLQRPQSRCAQLPDRSSPPWLLHCSSKRRRNGDIKRRRRTLITAVLGCEVFLFLARQSNHEQFGAFLITNSVWIKWEKFVASFWREGANWALENITGAKKLLVPSTGNNNSQFSQQETK